MGDPKKHRKKYQKPLRPWDEERLKAEKKLVQEFGLVKKRELWKIEYLVKGFKKQAKRFIAKDDAQSKKEEQGLLEKLYRLKLLEQNAKKEDILGIQLHDILKRRLQSVVFAKGLARTAKQARQFILHGHVEVGGKRITVPSYLVKRVEEDTIMISPLSQLADEDHPERKKEKKPNAPNKEEKEEAKTEKIKKENEEDLPSEKPLPEEVEPVVLENDEVNVGA